MCATKREKHVGFQQIFIIEYNADGTIERYKSRLVAKGYTQTYGVDYSEMFSPMVNIDTIRVLFSVAANKDWSLHQFDANNAFLHRELKEKVYMEAPSGFSNEYQDNEVCRLKKTPLWVKTVISCMVRKIHSGHETKWVQPEKSRSHFF